MDHAPLPSRHVARKRQGVARHFAHQIAHIAAGWEIASELRQSFGGGQGVIFLDLLDGTAEVNGEQRLMGIFMVIRSWVAAELSREGLDPEWLKVATVTIRYAATPVESGLRYDLISEGHVETDYGSHSATIENFQFG